MPILGRPKKDKEVKEMSTAELDAELEKAKKALELAQLKKDQLKSESIEVPAVETNTTEDGNKPLGVEDFTDNGAGVFRLEVLNLLSQILVELKKKN